MTANLEMRLASLAARYTRIEQNIKELQHLIQSKSLISNQKTVELKGGNESNINIITNNTTPTRHCDPATITELQPCAKDTKEVAELRQWCLAHSLYSAIFRWVPSDYYNHSLQWRRDILQAPTIQHLCKSIVMENTHCIYEDCSHRENSRYYIIVFQYTEKFDAELLMRCIKDMNNGLGKKKFNFRLADPKIALELTGFGHGAVAPFGTKVNIPIILSDRILKLSPQVFWMGGGHVDCKVCVKVEEFVQVINPIIASVTTSLTAEELEHLVD